MWGPVGAREFAIYRDLGVGIYETRLNWAQVAPTRPVNPLNPRDRAYRWPQEVTLAVTRAARARMRVSIVLQTAPRWANGNHPPNWAPRRPADFADFARAAARRYPSVHLWMVWGEPNARGRFMPLTPERHGRPLNARQREAPRAYARILDAAYGALKRQSRRNLVIGGNTFTVGDIYPLNWIRNLRLPNGRPPRMDLYGHNPFTRREPDLRKPPSGQGAADFSDLDTLAGWLDRYLRGRRTGPARLKLFLSEFTAPTDHPNPEFNFWVDRRTQARWTSSALRITRSWSRIYTLGWHALYDDQPSAGRVPTNRGLIDARGRRKPAYYAFRRG
jgi:hypothetical protein